MTGLIPHLTRPGIETHSGFRPEGWHPTLSVTLLGPVPLGAALVWTVQRPDGTAWFDERMPVPALPAGEHAVVSFAGRNCTDLDEPGAAAFSLAVVSELVSVLEASEQQLHRGSLTATALDGDQRYRLSEPAVGHPSFVALDTVDEPDAPRLTVVTTVEGDVEAYQVEAHLRSDGAVIATASSVQSRHTLTANDGTVTGQELALVFDGVRGWNNLASTGWGTGWLRLDERDGRYEVVLVREAAPLAIVGFDIAGGRLVAPGGVERDPWLGPVVLLGDVGTDGSAAARCSIDDLYALRTEAAPVVVPDPAELQAFVDRAERLLVTWEADLRSGLPDGPVESGAVLAAEAVLRERAGYGELRDAVQAADAHPVTVDGRPSSLGEVHRRVLALFTGAEDRLTAAAGADADALGPYRRVLRGDKLAVFEEHPADRFVYTTTDRRVIETPHELAEATDWYFEGPLDLPATATAGGVEVSVSVQGWRVLGWHFDAEGNAVARSETQGQGPSAPLTAFRPST
jgi:hypothetical protein